MYTGYFIAANTKDGFYSLPDSFPPGKDDYLHIIKGCPGGGKSTFMRSIGAEAERKGFHVHYIYCSGDPDSLDGVYIPALNLAWIDGTSPHTREASVFGLDSDYINLGEFFKGGFTEEDEYYVNLYFSAYRQKYSSAYLYLNSAFSLKEAVSHLELITEKKAGITKRIDSVLRRCCHNDPKRRGRCGYRFLSAVSCVGDCRLNAEIYKLCKLIYQLDDRFSQAHQALAYAAKAAEAMGEDVICCPSPLCPQRLSAVILPKSSLCFADSSWSLEDARHIRSDSLFSEMLSASARAELKCSEKLSGRIMEQAYSKLREAKALHDMLENIYKAHIDYEALNQFTDMTVKEIFS